MRDVKLITLNGSFLPNDTIVVMDMDDERIGNIQYGSGLYEPFTIDNCSLGAFFDQETALTALLEDYRLMEGN
jgi:hypothetical protein